MFRFVVQILNTIGMDAFLFFYYILMTSSMFDMDARNFTEARSRSGAMSYTRTLRRNELKNLSQIITSA